MNCPKCGFEQSEGPECLRCGLIFVRYNSILADPAPQTAPISPSENPKAGIFRRLYRILKWTTPAILILTILLIFHPSKPPQVDSSPESAKQAEAKVQEFQSYASQGIERRLALDEAELNGWLSKKLIFKKQEDPASDPASEAAESLIDTAKKAAGDSELDSVAAQQGKSSLRDLKIRLLEDSLRLYATVDVHGMDLSLELEGRPLVRDGYLRLELDSAKIGSFPLSGGTLQSTVDRLVNSPQNKEKFRLLPGIKNIRVEHGRLIVTSE